MSQYLNNRVNVLSTIVLWFFWIVLTLLIVPIVYFNFRYSTLIIHSIVWLVPTVLLLFSPRFCDIGFDGTGIFLVNPYDKKIFTVIRKENVKHLFQFFYRVEVKGKMYYFSSIGSLSYFETLKLMFSVNKVAWVDLLLDQIDEFKTKVNRD